jgi:hypothetical protein
LGNNPDNTAFFRELSNVFKTQLKPLQQMNTAQKLHVLSHIMYSGEIPNYSNERMKAAPFDLINRIEQLRLDYVPNANDGSQNIYKVIFNNLIREEVVATLPEQIQEDFVQADEAYQTSGDFETLVATYRQLIASKVDAEPEITRAERKQVQPGQITSEWLAKINASLSPFREGIEKWDDLSKYQALQFLLRGSKDDLSNNKVVKRWVDGIDDIRASYIHDANNYGIRNEQKVFYNNNLRSVLKESLPAHFRTKYDEINNEFQNMELDAQANNYENYLEKLRTIVFYEMGQL